MWAVPCLINKKCFRVLNGLKMSIHRLWSFQNLLQNLTWGMQMSCSSLMAAADTIRKAPVLRPAGLQGKHRIQGDYKQTGGERKAATSCSLIFQYRIINQHSPNPQWLVLLWFWATSQIILCSARVQAHTREAILGVDYVIRKEES